MHSYHSPDDVEALEVTSLSSLHPQPTASGFPKTHCLLCIISSTCSVRGAVPMPCFAGAVPEPGADGRRQWLGARSQVWRGKRRRLVMHLVGHNCCGRCEPLTTVVPCSTYCHYAEANGVHALLAGEVSEWPGVDVVAANHDGEMLHPLQTWDGSGCSWIALKLPASTAR